MLHPSHAWYLDDTSYTVAAWFVKEEWNSHACYLSDASYTVTAWFVRED